MHVQNDDIAKKNAESRPIKPCELLISLGFCHCLVNKFMRNGWANLKQNLRETPSSWLLSKLSLLLTLPTKQHSYH